MARTTYALFLLALAAGLPAAAQSVPASPAGIQELVSASNGAVTVAGRAALRLHTSHAGIRPDQRAALVAERLRAALARGVDPRSLTVRKEPPDAVIAFGADAVCTVTRAEARAQLSDAGPLAELWAHRLRVLLTTPLLTVSSARVVVPLHEARAVTLGGLLPAERVEGSGEVVNVALDGSGRKAVLRGLRAGDVRLTFSAGGVVVPVDVAVRPWAGSFPASVQATVTGSVAPKELIARVAAEAARRALVLQPEVTAAVGKPKVPAALYRGRTECVRVPVRMTGPGCLPVTTSVPVLVNNQALPHADPVQLFYSNDPERVRGYGTLFLGRLADGRPARLLYHHQNVLGHRMLLSVEVVNLADGPAKVHVTEGEASANLDPIQAGARAARRFMHNDRSGIGYITEVPPGESVCVARYSLRPWQVASGLFALRQLDGPAGCYVQVKADDADNPFVRPPSGTERLSATIFGPAIKRIDDTFEVGGPWSFIRIGDARPGAGRLTAEGFGDYGITYDIKLTLSNPTLAAQRVGLVFEAASGQARCLFLLDGKQHETPPVGSLQEMVLATYMLAPGARRVVHLSTLPLSGSAYPARLVVRPLPQTAAIRAGSLLVVH